MKQENISRLEIIFIGVATAIVGGYLVSQYFGTTPPTGLQAWYPNLETQPATAQGGGNATGGFDMSTTTGVDMQTTDGATGLSFSSTLPTVSMPTVPVEIAGMSNTTDTTLAADPQSMNNDGTIPANMADNNTLKSIPINLAPVETPQVLPTGAVKPGGSPTPNDYQLQNIKLGGK